MNKYNVIYIIKYYCIDAIIFSTIMEPFHLLSLRLVNI